MDEAERTRRAYDVVAADYAELTADVSAIEHAAERGLLAAFAELTRGRGPVGDLGCGPGRITAHVAALGVEAFGIDLSAGMVREARGRHPGLLFVQGSLARLPLRDASLAGALVWYSIVHTAPGQLPVVCAELARVVAPGGHVLLAFQAGHGDRVERDQAYGHRVALTGYRHDPTYVGRVLERAGLGLVSRTIREPVEPEQVRQAFLLVHRG